MRHESSLNILALLLRNYALKLRQFLSRCESPIEELFFINFFLFLELNADDYSHEFLYDPIETDDSQVRESRKGLWRKSKSMGYVLAEKLIVRYGVTTVEVIPQYEIKLSRSYRVDFGFCFARADGTKRIICVECDGRDFHHKTTEQIDRDNYRDRDLLSNGYFVLRYSGAELNRNSGTDGFVKFVNQIFRLAVLDLVAKQESEIVLELRKYIKNFVRSKGGGEAMEKFYINLFREEFNIKDL